MSITNHNKPHLQHLLQLTSSPRAVVVSMRELKLVRLPWCDFLRSSEGSSLPGEPPRWILDRRSFSRHWPIGIPNTKPPALSATHHVLYIYLLPSISFLDSMPDGTIGILHRHNPSGRAMALGSTQSLTEMSTWDISWGGGGGLAGAYGQLSSYSGNLNLLQP
jgi:hypothetical protein